MHYILRRTLTQTALFKPIAGQDIHGHVSYGPVTTGVPCRFSMPTGARRMQDVQEELITNTVTAYLDGPDFDPDAVPVGSLMQVPNGQWRRISAIDSPLGLDGVVDHHRLTVGQ